MKLKFRKFGQGEPLIVLHGVFGSADNWQTVGKTLSTQYQVYLVDQRNHGNSPHDDEFTYSAMADDLLSLIIDENLGKVNILGHSMGGKTAMTFASHYPERMNKLIVVDIAPKEYPPHHEEIFKAFRSVDLANLSSRNEADEQLSNILHDLGTRQFILKNLTRSVTGFEWKLNLDAIEANALNVGSALDEEDWFNGHVLFIGGSKSNYIKEEDHDGIRTHFPNAKIEYLRAGHWVHAEQPIALTNMVLDFLKNG